jgi:GAF domain-containing protein
LRACRIAARCSQPGEVFSALTEKLLALAPYDLCAVTFVTQGAGDNTVVHARGRRAHLLEGHTSAMGEGVTGWVIANGKPFSNVDPKLDFPGSSPVEFPSYRTLAAHPIIKNNHTYGAVSLYSSTLDHYSADHLKLIERAVSLAAAALSSAAPHASRKVRLQPGGDDFIPQAAIVSNVLN